MGEKVKSWVGFITARSPAFTVSPRLLLPSSGRVRDGVSQAKLHPCTSAHSQMLPRNKHPHVNPVESFDLGGGHHHHQLFHFLFPMGKNANGKTHYGSFEMCRSCICWQTPVLGDEFLTAAGQNASRERLYIPDKCTARHILCRVDFSSVPTLSHAFCCPHLLPVGLTALSSNFTEISRCALLLVITEVQ